MTTATHETRRSTQAAYRTDGRGEEDFWDAASGLRSAVAAKMTEMAEAANREAAEWGEPQTATAGEFLGAAILATAGLFEVYERADDLRYAVETGILGDW